jgi:hypothetical protein
MSWRSASRRIGVPCFLPVPIDGRELSCHDKTVQMASKKHGTIRQLAESAGSPIDFVSAAGSVQVPQDLISGLRFTRIDFGAD